MSRTKLLSIGKPITKIDDYGRAWYMVTYRKKGKEHTVCVEIVVVNGRVSMGADQCPEEDFADLVRMFSNNDAKIIKLMEKNK